MRRRTRHLIVAAGVLVAAIWVAAVFVLSLPQFGGELTGERLARARANPHYRDGRLRQSAAARVVSFRGCLEPVQGAAFRRRGARAARAIPVVAVDAAALKQAPAARGLRAFWIGHASAYIEIDGARLLIDPIFSDYASPFEIGPKRFHPPPVRSPTCPGSTPCW
jgi:hypothetical protein